MDKKLIKKNLIFLARIDATKSILDDIINRCPSLSIMMIRNIGINDEDGGAEALFEMCVRDSDSIMDCDSIKTLSIITIVEEEKIVAITGFNRKAYKLYSGHIGFLEYDDKKGKDFFDALEKEFGK